jgi:hypothetical protein
MTTIAVRCGPIEMPPQRGPRVDFQLIATSVQSAPHLHESVLAEHQVLVHYNSR